VSQKDLSPSFRASIALSPRELREWYKEIFIDRVTWLTVSTNHTSEFFSPPDSSLAFFLDNQDVPCSNFDVIIESATPFCARVEREGLVATKKKSERCTEQPNEAGMYSRTFLYDLSRLPWMPDWALTVRREQPGLIGVSLKCSDATSMFSISFVLLIVIFWAF
jgi:hypothetical protein